MHGKQQTSPLPGPHQSLSTQKSKSQPLHFPTPSEKQENLTRISQQMTVMEGSVKNVVDFKVCKYLAVMIYKLDSSILLGTCVFPTVGFLDRLSCFYSLFEFLAGKKSSNCS